MIMRMSLPKEWKQGARTLIWLRRRSPNAVFHFLRQPKISLKLYFSDFYFDRLFKAFSWKVARGIQCHTPECPQDTNIDSQGTQMKSKGAEMKPQGPPKVYKRLQLYSMWSKRKPKMPQWCPRSPKVPKQRHKALQSVTKFGRLVKVGNPKYNSVPSADGPGSRGQTHRHPDSKPMAMRRQVVCIYPYIYIYMYDRLSPQWTTYIITYCQVLTETVTSKQKVCRFPPTKLAAILFH